LDGTQDVRVGWNCWTVHKMYVSAGIVGRYTRCTCRLTLLDGSRCTCQLTVVDCTRCRCRHQWWTVQDAHVSWQWWTVHDARVGWQWWRLHDAHRSKSACEPTQKCRSYKMIMKSNVLLITAARELASNTRKPKSWVSVPLWAISAFQVR